MLPNSARSPYSSPQKVTSSRQKSGRVGGGGGVVVKKEETEKEKEKKKEPSASSIATATAAAASLPLTLVRFRYTNSDVRRKVVEISNSQECALFIREATLSALAAKHQDDDDDDDDSDGAEQQNNRSNSPSSSSSARNDNSSSSSSPTSSWSKSNFASVPPVKAYACSSSSGGATMLPTSSRFLPVPAQVSSVQRLLNELEYSFLPLTSFFDLRKRRSLRAILETAREILVASLPIRCLEAVFVGLLLTSSIRNILRFSLSFTSESAVPPAATTTTSSSASSSHGSSSSDGGAGGRSSSTSVATTIAAPRAGSAVSREEMDFSIAGEPNNEEEEEEEEEQDHDEEEGEENQQRRRKRSSPPVAEGKTFPLNNNQQKHQNQQEQQQQQQELLSREGRRQFRHIVLGIAHGTAQSSSPAYAIPHPSSCLFGTIGLSRRSCLMDKDIMFSSILDLVEDFRVGYKKVGHRLVSFRLGLPIECDVLSRFVPMWNFIEVLIPEGLRSSKKTMRQFFPKFEQQQQQQQQQQENNENGGGNLQQQKQKQQNEKQKESQKGEAEDDEEEDENDREETSHHFIHQYDLPLLLKNFESLQLDMSEDYLEYTESNPEARASTFKVTNKRIRSLETIARNNNFSVFPREFDNVAKEILDKTLDIGIKMCVADPSLLQTENNTNASSTGDEGDNEGNPMTPRQGRDLSARLLPMSGNATPRDSSRTRSCSNHNTPRQNSQQPQQQQSVAQALLARGYGSSSSSSSSAVPPPPPSPSGSSSASSSSYPASPCAPSSSSSTSAGIRPPILLLENIFRIECLLRGLNPFRVAQDRYRATPNSNNATTTTTGAPSGVVSSGRGVPTSTSRISIEQQQKKIVQDRIDAKIEEAMFVYQQDEQKEQEEEQEHKQEQQEVEAQQEHQQEKEAEQEEEVTKPTNALPPPPQILPLQRTPTPPSESAPPAPSVRLLRRNMKVKKAKMIEVREEKEHQQEDFEGEK